MLELDIILYSSLVILLSGFIGAAALIEMEEYCFDTNLGSFERAFSLKKTSPGGFLFIDSTYPSGQGWPPLSS